MAVNGDLWMDTARLNLLLNVLTVVLGGGALGIILKYRLGTRKLDLDSEEAIRDHYAKEVAALRGQLLSMEDHYRRMLEDSDRRHEECQGDRDKLRERVRQLEQHVEGLEAQIRQNSQSTAYLFGKTPILPKEQDDES